VLPCPVGLAGPMTASEQYWNYKASALRAQWSLLYLGSATSFFSRKGRIPCYL